MNKYKTQSNSRSQMETERWTPELHLSKTGRQHTGPEGIIRRAGRGTKERIRHLQSHKNVLFKTRVNFKASKLTQEDKQEDTEMLRVIPKTKNAKHEPHKDLYADNSSKRSVI